MKLINEKALIGAIKKTKNEFNGAQKSVWFCIILGGIYFSVIKNLYVSIPILILNLVILYLLFSIIKYKYKKNINDETYLQDGTHTINNNNTTIKVTLINGKRDGQSQEFYINGQLKDQSTWKNGKRDGQSEEFYINGQLKDQSTWKNGKRDGQSENFYISGQLEIQSTWKNGIKDGKEYYYNDDGSLITESDIENGEWKAFIEYDKYGKIKMKKNGDEYSFFYWYNFLSKNIKICKIIIGYGGKFLGIWTNYRPNGEIDYQLDFDNALIIEKNITDNYKQIDCYKVRKIIYNTFGEVESDHLITLKDKSHYQTSPLYSYYRFNEIEYSYSSGLKGPPGLGGNRYIEIKQVLGINDLIEIK